MPFLARSRSNAILRTVQLETSSVLLAARNDEIYRWDLLGDRSFLFFQEEFAIRIPLREAGGFHTARFLPVQFLDNSNDVSTNKIASRPIRFLAHALGTLPHSDDQIQR